MGSTLRAVSADREYPPTLFVRQHPRFEYGSWPDGLYTDIQLRRMHMKRRAGAKVPLLGLREV